MIKVVNYLSLETGMCISELNFLEMGKYYCPIVCTSGGVSFIIREKHGIHYMLCSS